MGDKFLNGHSLFIGPWVIRFSPFLPPFFYITCGIGLVVKIFQNYDNLGLIIECCHMLIHMIVGFQTTLISTKQKERVLRLNALLDKFDVYPELKAEGELIKAGSKVYLEAMYATFSRCILVAINIYVLFPVRKLFTESGRSQLSKVLVWPMWMWVPDDTWWGFMIVFLFELMTSVFLLLSVMYTVPYLACLGNMTSSQCKLIIASIDCYRSEVPRFLARRQNVNNFAILQEHFRSSDERITHTSKIRNVSYEDSLNYEIDRNIRRLNLILRSANELSDIFKYYLSSFYYGGMFAVCMSGLQAVAADEDVEQSLKFMGILAGELVAIGLATVVSEEIIQGFTDVRTSIYNSQWYNFPKLSCKRLQLMSASSSYRGLRTMFGYELTLLHFGDVLNASYKYYNLLLLTVK